MPPHFSSVLVTNVPGVAVKMSTQPTRTDAIGMDGIYVDFYFIFDQKLFQNYVDHIAKTWYKFTDN